MVEVMAEATGVVVAGPCQAGTAADPGALGTQVASEAAVVGSAAGAQGAEKEVAAVAAEATGTVPMAAAGSVGAVGRAEAGLAGTREVATEVEVAAAQVEVGTVREMAVDVGPASEATAAAMRRVWARVW